MNTQDREAWWQEQITLDRQRKHSLHVCRQLLADASRHNPKLYTRPQKQDAYWNWIYLVLVIVALACIAVGIWALVNL